jgi:hypothetical protein
VWADLGSSVVWYASHCFEGWQKNLVHLDPLVYLLGKTLPFQVAEFRTLNLTVPTVPFASHSFVFG